ncbi:MAG: hypothetical protein J5I59_08365 [Saprospiraceae bacterium]|nr:hypothetical protein [Saprospiraceae bacterium]
MFGKIKTSSVVIIAAILFALWKFRQIALPYITGKSFPWQIMAIGLLIGICGGVLLYINEKKEKYIKHAVIGFILLASIGAFAYIYSV